MKTDLVSLIEVAYQVEDSEPTSWLTRLTDTVMPLLDHGMGCSAFFYDARDVNRLQLHGYISNNPRDGGEVMKAIEKSSPERVAWTFRTQACRSASEGPDWVNQPAAKLFRTWGIYDVLFVNGLDTSGQGVLLTAKLGKLGEVNAAAKRRWARIAAHIGAGHRLVRRLTKMAPAAVLTPGGKVEHTTEETAPVAARSALREAVSVIERARGKLRRTDPDDAVNSWKGLVAARWSLVDQFDSDGKRYIIAHENVADAPSTPALSQRERQAVAYARMGHSNKYIAYELGVSASTVGVLLHRAALKLKAKTRQELLAAAETNELVRKQ